MPKLNNRIPKYRLHRHSGQAIVTLNGQDHYLGPHGTKASKAEYDRLVAEWLAGGRNLPQTDHQTAAGGQPIISVNRIIRDFWRFALVYYRKPDGSPSGEVDNFRRVLRPLRRLYGQSEARRFGPTTLKALREHFISLKWCRTSVNRQISRIRQIFGWAVENELLPAAVYQALLAVRGLRRGRTMAPEAKPVKPAPEDYINAVKPFVSEQVWALIQLQLLTGARAGELVGLRGIDLKTGEKIWTVEPDEHKTAYLGHSKRIYFGPQAKAIVQGFLRDRPLDAYLFSPAQAEKERREKLHAGRITPPTWGNRPGTNRCAHPERSPADCYTVNSYRQAIWRGCDKAFPPPDHLARKRIKRKNGERWGETIKEWKERLTADQRAELKAWRNAHRWHPHQLRHNAATYIRKEFGIEIARIILGHRSASVTEIYAEIDDEKAKKVMRKIG